MVPARAGSKRLPNKNKLVLGDKPLVSHSIDFAKHHHKIENVLVSTDDPEIQGIAVASGVMSPWLRPTSLSADDSRIVYVLIHAINWYEVNFFPVFGVYYFNQLHHLGQLNCLKEHLSSMKLQIVQR